MNYSYDELERTAYITGNTILADLYYTAGTLQRLDDDLPYGFDFETPMDQQFEAHVEKEIARHCPDYAEYKQFFEDCFEQLNEHYSCPDVTSDHDKSVIFEAISKGDTECI